MTKQKIAVMDPKGKLINIIRRAVTRRHTVRMNNTTYQVKYFPVRTVENYFGFFETTNKG